MIYGVLPEFSTSSVVLYIYFSNMTLLLIECKPAIVINLKPSSECCKSQIVCTEIGADHRCYQIAAANRSAPENNPSLLQHIPSTNKSPPCHGAVSQGHGIEGYQTTPYLPDPSPSVPASLESFIIAITFFAATFAASIPQS